MRLHILFSRSSILRALSTAALLVASTTFGLVPRLTSATYQTNYAACGSLWAEGNAYSGYHASLYFGAAGSTLGSCYSTYFSGWVMCFDNSMDYSSGTWRTGNFTWYSWCGTNVAQASHGHRGCYTGGSPCSSLFTTSAQEP